MMNQVTSTVNGNMSNDISLLHKAVARVEDPRQRGMYIACDSNGQCYLSMPNRASGRLARYEVAELLADLQIDQGRQWQIGPKEIADKKLYIFMYNADFGPKAVAMSEVLPETSGTFLIFTLLEGASNPHLIAASASGYQLDLTAIGVANRKTLEPFGLRAVFTSTPTPFGVAAVTTTKEHIALWYKEKLGKDKPITLPAEEDEQIPQPSFETYRWGDNYER